MKQFLSILFGVLLAGTAMALPTPQLGGIKDSGTNTVLDFTTPGVVKVSQGVLTITSGTNVLRITGTTPLVTNAFAQAMNQGVATGDDVVFNNLDTGGIVNANGVGYFVLNTISLGDNSGPIASIDSIGVGHFASSAVSIGDNSGFNGSFDSNGNIAGNTINLQGAGYFAGGAVSIGDNIGSSAYINGSGNGLFQNLTTVNNALFNTIEADGDALLFSVHDSVTSGGVYSINSDGTFSFCNGLISGGSSGALTAASFVGDASGLLSLNASELAEGSVPFERLPIGTSSLTVVVGNDSRIIGAQAAIVRVAGTLTSGTATIGNALISGSNCWPVDNSSSLTNVGTLTVTTSGTTATIRSTNVLDASPFSLFIKP